MPTELPGVSRGLRARHFPWVVKVNTPSVLTAAGLQTLPVWGPAPAPLPTELCLPEDFPGLLLPCEAVSLRPSLSSVSAFKTDTQSATDTEAGPSSELPSELPTGLPGISFLWE